MKEILYNNDNLKNSDIDEVVTRTKALIVNDKDEIMLGYAHRTYQFPGGHLNPGETLLECLIRELKEETGIEFNDLKVDPFLKIIHYNKNYRDTNKNRENDIYFYIIKSNKLANIENTNLDEWEKDGNYTIKYIKLDDVRDVLINSINDNPFNKVIVKEMLEALDEYSYINK